MILRKITQAPGKISVFCDYLFDEHGNSSHTLRETDIRTALKIFNENAMGATISRGDKVVAHGSRGRKLKRPIYTGLTFRFTVSLEDAEFFSESAFALMR